MMIRKLLYFAVAFGMLPAASDAQEVPQALTITRLNAEVKTFLSDSANADVSVHNLSTEKPTEGAFVSVNIDGKIYYFTPKNAENQNKLQTLANIGSVALVQREEAAGAIYELNGDYYGYNTDQLPLSGYTLEASAEKPQGDSDVLYITRYEKDEDGALQEKYYEVIVDPSKYSEVIENDSKKIEATITGKTGEGGWTGDFWHPEPFKGGAAFLINEDDSIAIENKLLKNNKVKALITADGDRKYASVLGGAIYNVGEITKITADFIGNSISTDPSYDAWVSVYGGAIYNAKGSTIGNITGDFIGNYASGDVVYGGAISNEGGTIGNITGDFIGNYAFGYDVEGGAIYNYKGTIGDIKGDFIGNHVSNEDEWGGVFGGAISNYNGTIGNITGDFVGNYVSGYTIFGGAIYNDGDTIGNITGDFIGNYASGDEAYGGAISNINGNSTIGNITGDFIGNYASGDVVYGGAISNEGGTIGNITGDFIGNYISVKDFDYSSTHGGAISNYGAIGNITGDFIGNYISVKGVEDGDFEAFGGAINNDYGTIGEIDADGNVIGGIINSNFYDNYVKITSGEAQGGAIWTNKDLNIIADNGSSTFKGNYVQVGEGEKEYQAIYVSSSSTNLNLIARNNGTINMYDGINGVKGYNVNISGDGTGRFNLYNGIYNANVVVRDVTMNFDVANGETKDYTFLSLDLGTGLNYALDIDLADKKADMIKTTNASTGVVTITSLNVVKPLTEALKGAHIIQILSTQNDALQLALSGDAETQLQELFPEYKKGDRLGGDTIVTPDEIKAATKWNDEYKTTTREVEYLVDEIGLATTETTNDSIGLSVEEKELSRNVESLGDTLALWNGLDVTEAKSFEFDGAADVYEASDALGETKGAKLSIKGVAEGDNRSTINLNGNKGFEVSGASAFDIADVEITGGQGSALWVTNSEANVSLNNVKFIGNETTANGGAIYNQGGYISGISGEFEGNKALVDSTNTALGNGGAIYNYYGSNGTSKMGNITADFARNEASVNGGAIYNNFYSVPTQSVIGSITGDFTDNKALSGNGGAIHNRGIIDGDINGNFTGNTAAIHGGAIYNHAYYATSQSVIGNINGDFAYNSAANGGAIYNYYGQIGNITGDFFNNTASSGSGGAIYSMYSVIGDIHGNFANNTSKYHGGAIFNSHYSYYGSASGVIGNIKGDFTDNKAGDEKTQGEGGAIYNYKDARINGGIEGNFARNIATGYGGAITNYGYISSISSRPTDDGESGFTDNKGSYGGAIYNTGTIFNGITADFARNEATFSGGAICIQGGSIGDINGNFTDNTAVKDSGGAIYNSGGVINGSIKGDFTHNTALSWNGGAIANYTSILGEDGISGNFARNEANYGGAIYNSGGITGGISGDFTDNKANNYHGGAIYNRGYISSISSKLFARNTAGEYGGAIYNVGGITGGITGDFEGNSAQGRYTAGGAIYNTGTIGDIVGSFTDNSSTWRGGAIWTSNNLSFLADGRTSTFKGNYVEKEDGQRDYQAIWVDSDTATLNFTAKNGGVINMHDNINGKEGYTVNISGDESGTFNLYDSIYNGNVVVRDVTMNFDVADGVMKDYTFSSLDLENGLNYALDIDLAGKKADTIRVANTSTGVVTITSLNIADTLAIDPDKEYKIQILYTENDALKLALSDELEGEFAGKEYLIGVLSKAVSDEVHAETSWQDTYEMTEKQTKVYGTLSLATTVTENDSIGVNIVEIKEEDKKLQGDTLALWNESENDTKEFNFDDSDNTYIVGEAYDGVTGLGEAKGAELSINGVADEEGNRSTIDLNERKGFEVNGETAVYITNTEIVNGDGAVLDVTNKDASVVLTNVNLKDNSAATGGAISSAGDVVIVADGQTSTFAGNKAGNKNVAIYMDEANLTLVAVHEGEIIFEDGIDGKDYNINVSAAPVTMFAAEAESDGVDAVDDVTNRVVFNDVVDHVGAFNMDAGATVRLGTKARVNAASYNAADGATLEVDMSVDAAVKKIQNAVLKVSGDVIGVTNVIVNALTPDVYAGAETLYVDAPKDTMGTNDSFKVSRVIGSPYMWASALKTDDGHKWYLQIVNQVNEEFEGEAPDIFTPATDPDEGDDNNGGEGDKKDPSGDDNNGGEGDKKDPNGDDNNQGGDEGDKKDPSGDDNNQGGDEGDKKDPSGDEGEPDVSDKDNKPLNPVYAPEVAAYTGLLRAAVEQNRSVAGSVVNGLAHRQSVNCFEESCGVAESMPKKQAWIDMTHENATIDAPVEMDAKINGVTLGLDLYREGAARAGLFGAYRYGKYDLSGKGKYYSTMGSDIRSKSYLGGAYYQYDDSDVRLTGTLFAGNQDMNIRTSDGMARADSDVFQYGASVEAAKRFEVRDYWNFEPSFGVYYTLLDADDLRDNVGKSAKFEELHYLEVEAGVKFEREVCNDGQTNRFYIKPSVIRTFSKGGRAKISGLDKVRSVKDATLGRVELGGEFGLDESWSGYAHTGVTFGDDYESYDFTVGAQYRF